MQQRKNRLNLTAIKFKFFIRNFSEKVDRKPKELINFEKVNKKRRLKTTIILKVIYVLKKKLRC